MTKTDLKNLKQILLSTKSELEKIKEGLADSADTVELDQSRVGRLSRMDALQNQQMALEAERRRELQLTKIEGALRRIESDAYGMCFICGNDIEIQRLSTDPTITRCVGCVDE